MSATPLLGIVVLCLGVLFALAVWGVCLIAGAARPMHRGTLRGRSAATSEARREGGPAVQWRPRQPDARPRTHGRITSRRRSLHSLWRD